MILDAHAFALGEMAKSLLPISKGIVHGHFPSNQMLVKIKDKYLTTVGKSLAEATEKSNSEFGEYMRTDGKSWLHAGLIFAKLADVNKEIQSAANIHPDVVDTDKIESSQRNGVVDYAGALNGIRAYKFWRKSPAGVVATGSNGYGGSGGGEKFSLLHPDFSKLFQPFRSQAVDGALYALTRGDTNLLTGLVNAGNTILAGSLAGLATSYSVISIGEMVAGTKFFGSGAGGLSGTAAALDGLVSIVGLFLIVLGVTLAVYLPFLPLIIWYGAVLGWVITVLEAIIAAPLWMFTHMESEGEGMGQKTAYGYLFLINVLFRPALMVMSLIAAWLILDVFGYFLKDCLSILYGSSSYSFSGISSIFTFFGVLVVFTSLAVFTVNKCFYLIDVLPNQVFAWVGGHYQGTGGTDAHKEGHQMIVGGVQNVRGQAQMKNRQNGEKSGVNSITGVDDNVK